MRRNWITATLGILSTGWIGGAMQAQELGFLEKFALAEDRTKALQDLIPGSHEFFYYHILHFQNAGQWTEAEALLQQWSTVPTLPASFQQMRTRQRILGYSKNPQEALEYLRLELGLSLDHAPPQADRAKNLATQLDPALYNPKTLLEAALAQDPGLSQISDDGLIELLGRDLPIDTARSLLQRISRVDVVGLLPLIERELRHQETRGWGAFNVHGQLTLEQRKELARGLPQLLENDAFVRQYLLRLMPSDDVAADNIVERRAHLQRLEDFTATLPPSQNSLKGLILFQRLALDATEEKFDRSRFEKYLALPRYQVYYSLEYLKATERVPLLEFQANYLGETRLPPIADDTALIRRYLEHFLQADDSINRFSKWLDRGFLESVLTETKILYGIGNNSTWYARLNPQQQKELRERVELRFAPSSKPFYRPEDEVQLVVDIKNVPKLIVRIYQLNPQNIYRKQGKPVSTDIDLDGLVANAEQTLEFTLPSDRRHRETIALPQCAGRGAWVIDLLGGGLRSRALVVKGQLRSTQVLTDAGHELRVFDENGQPVTTATIEMGTRTFRPSEQGAILIPYGDTETTLPILLVDGAAATVEIFTHRRENYTLEMGVLMDSQNLLSGAKGSLIIRPQILCNGQPISIKALEGAQLTILTTDQDGTQSTLAVPGLELNDDGEATHQFLVPQRLRTVQVTLSGRILAISRKVHEPLTATQSLQVNDVATTAQVSDFYLIQNESGFRLQVRGRNGEPIARLPATIQMWVDQVNTTPMALLATDENGQVDLGGMKGVARVQASAAGLATRMFLLRRNVTQWPARMSMVAGTGIELPWTPSSMLAGEKGTEWTLLETRSGNVVAEWNKKVVVRDGRLVIESLDPGLYYLTNRRTGAVLEIRSVKGSAQSGFILGAAQSIEESTAAPGSIAKTEVQDDKLRVQISGVTPSTRVHFYASSFLEDSGLSSQLRLSGFGQFRQPFAANPSYYIDALKLDEEYQYILQRQYATKFPGNLLAQPSLLLNPWDTASTANARQEAKQGDAPPMASAAPMAADYAAGLNRLNENAAGGLGRSYFEFLANSGVFLANRRTDKEGWIELPLKGLAGYQTITAVVVDGSGITSQTIPLAPTEFASSDLRLGRSFPEEKHLTQIQRAQFLDPDTKLDVGDARSTRIQVYSSLADVYRLYSSLSPSPELEKFRVLTRWHQLSEEEKSRTYSELACHELHVFLYFKDRDFFDRVVAQYLGNKFSKQLVDRFLLEQELSDYMELWQRNRLNTMERVLMGNRIPDIGSGVRKWIDDASSVYVIPPEVRTQKFLAALAGASLDLSRPESAAATLADLSDKSQDPFGADSNRFGALREAKGGLLGEQFDKSAVTDGTDDAFGAFNWADNGRFEEESLEFDAPAGYAGGMPGAGGTGGGTKDEKQLGRRGLRRKALQREMLFSPLDTTREWAESQYYRTRIQQQGLALIPPSPVWKELAHADSLDHFLSTEFHLSNHTLTELLMVMAVLDLPFDAPKVQLNIEEGRLTVTSPSRCVVFVESIENAKDAESGASVMVGQDLYLVAPGADVDPQKPVTGQALVRGVGYRASVVVTNPSSQPKTISVLTQIPQGALPLKAGKFVSSKTIRLEPYTTQQIAYSFYFPKSGDFTHYGAQASIDGRHATSGAFAQLKVLDAPANEDKETWGFVALWGTNDQVLNFLKTKNTQQIQLHLIAFRLADKDFYEACLSELERQGLFDATLWAYSVRQNDPRRIQQLLAHRNDWMPRFGPVFKSPLTDIDTARRYDYEHLDYRPLVNARSHLLGSQRVILNSQLASQYLRLLERIAFQPTISDGERMAVTYYMLVQNRIEEALTHFDRLAMDTLPNRLQYDYMDAYLDFYRGRYERAAEIADRYAAHGVSRWRDLFAQIRLQVAQRLAMIDGRAIPVADSHATNVTDPVQRMLLDIRNSDQTSLAAQTPSIDLSVQDGTLILGHQQVEKVDVRYYLMDIELLFSRNPFVQQDNRALMAIQPNRVETIALSAERGKHPIAIPKELANRNVLVEVTTGALSQSQVLYANSMDVTVVDAFGRLQVTAEGGKPVETTYVKVYARHQGGQVKFFKDGYTDLRGQFDYASLSTNDLDTVERFALLVLDPERGALIREAAPPKR